MTPGWSFLAGWQKMYGLSAPSVLPKFADNVGTLGL